MLADDFAPQLPADELASLASTIAADRPVVVLAAVPARLPELRQQIDPRRVELMLRELVMLVRRSLRGTDAVALAGDELLVVIDGPSRGASRSQRACWRRCARIDSPAAPLTARRD